MDTINELLDIIRVRGTVYFSKTITPPWAMEIAARPGFWRFHVVLAGSTWISLPDRAERAHLEAGDFVVVPRGQAHLLTDREDRSASSHHQIPGSEPLPVPQIESDPPRGGETQFLCGYFRFAEGVPFVLLEHLPDLLVVRGDSAEESGYVAEVVGLIQRELEQAQQGPVAVLNRLTEVLFFRALRQWLDTALLSDGSLGALTDPRLQGALAAIHDAPQDQWTVESLAQRAGQSRTAFAKAFRDATGFTPISYLAYWRAELARRLLTESDLNLDEIASRTGYADTNAFNRAFRRATGSSPGAFRKASRI